MEKTKNRFRDLSEKILIFVLGIIFFGGVFAAWNDIKTSTDILTAQDWNDLVANIGGTWTVNGANVYRASGKVGIGTDTPSVRLDVVGNIKASGTMCDKNGCIGDGLTSETDPQVGTLTNGKWCTSNGTTVNCTTNAPSFPDNCGPYIHPGTVTASAFCKSLNGFCTGVRVMSSLGEWVPRSCDIVVAGVTIDCCVP